MNDASSFTNCNESSETCFRERRIRNAVWIFVAAYSISGVGDGYLGFGTGTGDGDRLRDCDRRRWGCCHGLSCDRLTVISREVAGTVGESVTFACVSSPETKPVDVQDGKR